ncbi:MAG: DNA polymerase III subunit gamma/tau [Clostridiales Family XIII bacterium]|jgi:DNA polymerase-3 subunit gamma/tau|nr:DNA polymerase III subunit gamma/tau [Clostridiales Family XIII bacterium]
MAENERYIALYRRFRPETFDEVLGQEHVVRVLKHQIQTGSVGHAYLFSGTRGTGKTTMARLLAKGVNCLMGGDGPVPPSGVLRPCGICANCIAVKNGALVDVIEIDAASNNGVEDVRDLRDSIIYPPAAARKKVFIIDEVHMFSKAAFNALLKTLEEPPEHILFILCTTEPGKLPQTILSRCLKFDFRRVPMARIAEGIAGICAKIGIAITDDAAALIAANADGSVRDGLSILEQCVQAGEQTITREFVLEIVGSPGDESIAELTGHVASGDAAAALVRLDAMLADGMDEKRIMDDWIEWLRSALLIKFVADPERILNRSAENIAAIAKQGAAYETAFINEAIYTLAKLRNEARWSSSVRILFEMAIIEMSERKKDN